MIKYIVDEKGHKGEVIIPIEMWEKLKSLHQILPIHKMDKPKLRRYIGKIKLSIDPIIYQQAMRDEWE